MVAAGVPVPFQQFNRASGFEARDHGRGSNGHRVANGQQIIPGLKITHDILNVDYGLCQPLPEDIARPKNEDQLAEVASGRKIVLWNEAAQRLAKRGRLLDDKNSISHRRIPAKNSFMPRPAISSAMLIRLSVVLMM